MKVQIISGERNSSKTTTLKNIIENSDNKYLGYICESLDNKNSLFLRDLITNKKINILQTQEIKNSQRIGRYFIVENSFNLAKEQIEKYLSNKDFDNYIISLDEVGALELSNRGFNDLIKVLIEKDRDLILCVRDKFVREVCDKYNFNDIEIINVKNKSH